MDSLQLLLNNLQQIKIQLLYVEQEEQVRTFPHPKIPGLDLSLFDLSHEPTRSHLVIPEPMYVPAEWRFCQLVKELRTSIKMVRVYLQHDVYPYAKTCSGLLPKLEDAINLLEEKANAVEIPQAYYLDFRFIPDNLEEYCWDCASKMVSLTRSSLVFSCILLSRRYCKLAQVLWKLCGNWYDDFLGVFPLRYYGEPEDNPRRCDRCSTLLSHSLSEYGVSEECDRFLERDDELSPEDWWQLYMVFEGAHDEDWPSYIAVKLEKLIDKYELSPRNSVVEVVK